MEFFRRYLTAGNYLSWPVVVVSVGILLSGHLLDTPLNGTENIPQRSLLLVANQAAFFLMLWGCDRLVLRRIPESHRWLVVLGTISILAAGWGVAFTWQLWQLGFTPTFDFAPRIRGWLMSLSVMTVLVAMAYGLVAESARLQRKQADIARADRAFAISRGKAARGRLRCHRRYSLPTRGNPRPGADRLCRSNSSLATQCA
jgi:uncharacterized membrane protein